MNKYKVYADGVVVIHMLIILINFASLPVLFFNYKLGIILAVSAALAPLSWIASRDRCILTVWENNLRAKYDPSKTYSRGCVVHYLRKWFSLKVTNFQFNTFTWSYLGLIILTAILLK
jgi:hypothetical protein